MISQVGNENVKLFRQLRRHPEPVVCLPKKPVQQYQRRALAKLFEVKLHLLRRADFSPRQYVTVWNASRR